MSDDLRPHEDDELAAAVRRAFSAYRAPPGAPAMAAPQRPTMGQPRLLALSGVAAVAVVLLVAAIVLRSLAQPESAYASWTAVPSSPDPALALIATEQCRDGMVSAPPDADRSGSDMTEADREKLTELGDPSSLPLVAQDQRGDVALALFSDGRTYASCVVTSVGNGGYTAVGVGAVEGPRPGALRVLSGMAYEGEPPLRMVIGDVAADVAAVEIARDDGVVVTATVTGGYFLAWWPTEAGISSITAHDGQGSTLATLSGDVFE